MKKPRFLIQSKEMRQRDREEQIELKKQAELHGLPGKQDRRVDFLERSIKEVQRHMRRADEETKAHLKERSKFLRGELKRLRSQ